MLLRQRRYAEARPHYERAARSSTSPEPWVNLGLVARNLDGDLRSGAPYWERALEIDPQQPHALAFLADVELAGGRNEEAEALLLRALAAHPTFVPALERLARLYQRQGRAGEIEVHVARAREPTADLGARGRRLMRIIWGSLGLSLLACAAVAWREARSPPDTAP